MQGPLLGDATLAEAPWLNRDAPINQALITALYAGFVDRYGDQIAPAAPHGVRTAGRRIRRLPGPGGEPRTGSMVWCTATIDWTTCCSVPTAPTRPLTVVDWQTVSWGPATDRSGLLPRLCAVDGGSRREHYDALLRLPRALGPDCAHHLGATSREGVRRQSFFGVMMAIVSSMLVERTERGDAMFMTMLQRHCDHVLDTDALAIAARTGGAASRCDRRTEDESPTPRPTNRCGARAGMPTSPMPHRDSAAGYASA